MIAPPGDARRGFYIAAGCENIFRAVLAAELFVSFLSYIFSLLR
jgi:hypothetical protein